MPSQKTPEIPSFIHVSSLRIYRGYSLLGERMIICNVLSLVMLNWTVNYADSLLVVTVELHKTSPTYSKDHYEYFSSTEDHKFHGPWLEILL